MSKQDICIGSLALRDNAHIAAIVDSVVPDSVLTGLSGRGADLIEMRLDLFDKDIDATLSFVEHVRNRTGLPLIGTVRESERIGTDRLAVFERLLPLVDAVDIEIDAGIRDQVVTKADGKTVIISEHDFEKTPSTARLEALAREAVEAGASIVKIAAMPRSPGDVVRMLRFCSDTPHPMVAIAMGELGTISRVLAPLFGSLFSYAFLGDSVAPGQLSLDKLAEEFRLYYPSRRE